MWLTRIIILWTVIEIVKVHIEAWRQHQGYKEHPTEMHGDYNHTPDFDPMPPVWWLSEALAELGKKRAQAKFVRPDAYNDCAWCLVSIEAEHIPVPTITITTRGTFKLHWTEQKRMLSAEFLGGRAMTLITGDNHTVEGPTVHRKDTTNLIRDALVKLYPEIHQLRVADWQQQQSNL